MSNNLCSNCVYGSNLHVRLYLATGQVEVGCVDCSTTLPPRSLSLVIRSGSQGVFTPRIYYPNGDGGYSCDLEIVYKVAGEND